MGDTQEAKDIYCRINKTNKKIKPEELSYEPIPDKQNNIKMIPKVQETQSYYKPNNTLRFEYGGKIPRRLIFMQKVEQKWILKF